MKLSKKVGAVQVAVGPEATATVRLIMVAQAARSSVATTSASALFAPCSNTIWGGARHAKAVATLSRHGSECVKRRFREHWSLVATG